MKTEFDYVSVGLKNGYAKILPQMVNSRNIAGDRRKMIRTSGMCLHCIWVCKELGILNFQNQPVHHPWLLTQDCKNQACLSLCMLFHDESLDILDSFVDIICHVVMQIGCCKFELWTLCIHKSKGISCILMFLLATVRPWNCGPFLPVRFSRHAHPSSHACPCLSPVRQQLYVKIQFRIGLDLSSVIWEREREKGG